MRFDSEADYQAWLKGLRGRAAGAVEEGESKYHNLKVKTPEGTFDSKWEYNVWCQRKMMERAGLIFDLQRQVPFELIPSVVLDGKKGRPTVYLADFTYKVDGELVVEDAKGMESLPDYKIKRKLMKWVHNIEVKEIRKDG